MLALIYNTGLDNQENLENYLDFLPPEIPRTVVSWKINLMIENKSYLCKWVMWELDKVKTQ